MKRNATPITLILATWLLCSCSELLYTTIDVLRPAEVAFNTNANNLLIVDNTVQQPPTVGHKYITLNNETKNIFLKTDSTSTYCLASLADELDSKAFFSSIQLNPNSANEYGNYKSVKNLDINTINNLCQKYQADAILVLNKISEKDEISEFYNSYDRGTITQVLEVSFESNWSIHYPNQALANNLTYKDTLFWEGESDLTNNYTTLPNRYDGIVDGALYLGKKMSNRLTPYWDKEDRYFYNSRNKFIKQGIDSVYVKNWQGAIDCWSKALEKGSKSTRAFAYNNSAIAYEILGNFDKALEFANISLKYFKESVFTDLSMVYRTYDYIDKVTNRKDDIEKLNKQTGN